MNPGTQLTTEPTGSSDSFVLVAHFDMEYESDEEYPVLNLRLELVSEDQYDSPLKCSTPVFVIAYTDLGLGGYKRTGGRRHREIYKSGHLRLGGDHARISRY